MKVIHIIPSVFNYFDDIRASAFALVDTLHSAGVEADAFTLQYGSEVAGPSVQTTVKQAAPGRSYKGQLNINNAIETFSNYDIAHLHAPFFGAAGKILAWKQAHPEIPLVVTCHRRIITPDFLSLFLKLYSLYYLPKIFAVADIIIVPSLAKFQAYFGGSFRRYGDKLLEIDDATTFLGQDFSVDSEGEELMGPERLALKYLMVYNELVNQ
ncbi:MAG: hypothetical protein EXS55_03220 [Candidatus Magasanikbacteria bacterium]|nr:hypothetical protein [Candidatus Magasanikbacteria bacterium]